MGDQFASAERNCTSEGRGPMLSTRSWVTTRLEYWKKGAGSMKATVADPISLIANCVTAIGSPFPSSHSV